MNPTSPSSSRAGVLQSLPMTSSSLPPALTTHQGIPYFAVHKSHLHDSPIPGVFRLDLPERGDLTLPALSKDIHQVTVNTSQLCKSPVPDWFYVPIHVLNSVIHDVSDQPSGHTAARTRRTGSVTVCKNCRDVHKKCSGVGPCERCTKKGIAASCHSAGTSGPSQPSEAAGPSFQGYSLQPRLHDIDHGAAHQFMAKPAILDSGRPSEPNVPYWDAGIESALALNHTGSHPGYAHIPASSSIAPGSEHHMHHDGHGFDSNNWPYNYADNFAGPSQGT
ncbi:hypothetical protein C8Q74DRAFT_1221147 [Fomes fomentarius]|nr:hypothetical protein C8Q74DRAFT_1221147 [Fomes fomentarius]